MTSFFLNKEFVSLPNLVLYFQVFEYYSYFNLKNILKDRDILDKCGTYFKHVFVHKFIALVQENDQNCTQKNIL